MPTRMEQRGFTILEVVIVFILLAGLMAFAVPKIFDQFRRAQTQDGRMRLMHVAGQVRLYKIETGRYPDSLRELARQSSGSDKATGPYLREEDLKDPWGHEYRYAVPGTQGRQFDLVSLGADGKEGGDGDNRDLTN